MFIHPPIRTFMPNLEFVNGKDYHQVHPYVCMLFAGFVLPLDHRSISRVEHSPASRIQVHRHSCIKKPADPLPQLVQEQARLLSNPFQLEPRDQAPFAQLFTSRMRSSLTSLTRLRFDHHTRHTWAELPSVDMPFSVVEFNPLS